MFFKVFNMDNSEPWGGEYICFAGGGRIGGICSVRGLEAVSCGCLTWIRGLGVGVGRKVMACYRLLNL